MPFYQLLNDYPESAFGKVCFFCNSSKRKDEDERIISTLSVFDQENDPDMCLPCMEHANKRLDGFVCICESCVNEMAHLVGMLSVKDAKRLRDKTDSLLKTNDQLERQLTHAETALDAMKSFNAVVEETYELEYDG